MPAEAKNDLTAEYVRARLDYNPVTGVFTWRDHPDLYWKQYVGQVAGGVDKTDGYWKITILGRIYQASRLAWLHYYGEWPAQLVDHANTIETDNRIENLRDATVAQNSHNQRLSSANTSGYKGVDWKASRNKWRARVKVGKKRLEFFFDTPEAAAAKYQEVSKANFGEYARYESRE